MDGVESFLKEKVTLHCGDNREIIKQIPNDSIDSIVTDPPYALVSIVKRFANSPRSERTENTENPYGRTGRGFMGQRWDNGDTAHAVEFWAECLRILKPGGHVVAFAGTRTYHRMACAIEDAGFEIRDMLSWLYGSGFPKSHNIGNGLGTALKPANEPICLARKPLIGTVAANVLEWGTGAINIDVCRVEHITIDGGSLATNPHLRKTIKGGNTKGNIFPSEPDARFGTPNQQGRWPANVIHDGSEEVLAAFPDTTAPGGYPADKAGFGYNGGERKQRGERFTFDEGGSAARFFYTAKADSDDRLGSKHPTVKPVDLMQWLVRLVTPKGGLVLDPFAGTGTTAEACFREGMRCMLIERETEYQADIRRRMALVLAGPEERARESIKAKLKDQTIDAGPLFTGL